MIKHGFYRLVIVLTALLVTSSLHVIEASAIDIRGLWVGKAQGSIFGAEGTVTITSQSGEDIHGIVEGGNFLGTAKFGIRGKVRGNQIYGEKEGNIFRGFLYPDGSIRGAVKAIDGDTYQVFLRRPYRRPQAYGPPANNPYGQYPQGYPYYQYYQQHGR